jgi:23S rRNA (guanosine2251-2'-O)-methyltransferase
MKKILIINDIRSNYNVGAMFRTADGAGVEKIYLAGFTPCPKDRFGRVVGEIHKTALGAEESVAWEYVTSVIDLIADLKKEGYTVVSVEQDPNSIKLHDFKVPNKVAYIMGSETEGVPKDVLLDSDVILELPMLGKKESLNVSVTAGIVLYHR